MTENQEKYIFYCRTESQDMDFQTVSTDSQEICGGSESLVNVSWYTGFFLMYIKQCFSLAEFMIIFSELLSFLGQPHVALSELEVQ